MIISELIKLLEKEDPKKGVLVLTHATRCYSGIDTIRKERNGSITIIAKNK